MEPSITYRCIDTPSHGEGFIPTDCFATYFEPQSGFIERGEGDTWEEAVEDLRQKLERQGYDRSKLPKPKPENKESPASREIA